MLKKLTGLIVLLALPLTALAIDSANIQVSGEGEVEAVPDFIEIEISIEKIDKDRAVAKRTADQVTQQVLDVADDFDIDDDNIHASRLLIYPEYRWNDDQRKHIGERAIRTVSIKLHELVKYSDLAEALVQVDITRMYQRGSGFDNIDVHRNKAVLKALDNARIKADVIAEKIDRDIDEVYQVTESSNPMAGPHPVARMKAVSDSSNEAASAPLEIKAQTISASVHVIYLLD